MKIEIKEITPEVLRQVFPDFEPHCQRRLRTETIQKLQRGEVLFTLLATINKLPVGFTAIYKNKVGEKNGVTLVKTQWRGEGIGTLLLKKRTEMWPDLPTEVWEGSIASKRMCEKAGLSVIGQRVHWAEISREFRNILIFRKEDK